MKLEVLDFLLVTIFLAYSLYKGALSTSQMVGINAFALGKKSFSTFALSATIIATYASGSGFIMDLSETYTLGCEYIIPTIGMMLSSIFMFFVILPHCRKIFGRTSVAEVMKDQYGAKIGIITAITGIIGSIASIAVQIKIFGMVGGYFFNQYAFFNQDIFSFVVTIFIVVYCAMGGISGVVRTDIIQCVALFIAVFIMIGAMIGENAFLTPDKSYTSVKFDLINLLNIEKQNLIDMCLITLYFIFPSLSPASFQRLSMGVSIKQLKDSWIYSSVMLQLLVFSSCYVAYLLYAQHGEKEYDQVLATLISSCNFIGLKGILLVGLLAMLMSTADSYLNIASVLASNDIFFRHSDNFKKLWYARFFTIIIALIAFISTFFSKSLLDILFGLKAFYLPVVTMPLMAYLLNFKIPVPCVYASMIFGFGFVVICWIIGTDFKPIMPGMFINLFVLTVSTLIYKWYYGVTIRVPDPALVKKS